MRKGVARQAENYAAASTVEPLRCELPAAAINETHWQLMRCIIWFGEITCRLVHSGMDRGLVSRRRIRGNPSLPSEIYLPSNLQLMRQELWPDRHLCQHMLARRHCPSDDHHIYAREGEEDPVFCHSTHFGIPCLHRLFVEVLCRTTHPLYQP
jgi:hypothetical protein